MLTIGQFREAGLRIAQRPNTAAALVHRRAAVQRPFDSSCASSRGGACLEQGVKSHAPAPRGLAVCRSAAVLDAAPAAPTPALADLPLCSVINTQGMVLPENPEGTRGATYAIFDEKQKLQYIGTTPDLRNALRTALGRRPEKTHYYKAALLPTHEPTALQAVRDAWFSECGGQPNGNRLAIERSMWQQPVDAGAISERGRKGAAEEKTRQLLAALRDRGCKEDFTPNPTLLLEGQVDFLPARNLTDEELAAEREAEAARMRGRRSCSAVVDGQERVFHTSYLLKFPTNGGYMMDVSVLFDGRETTHRVIVGKQYYEPYGLAPEAAVEAGLALLLRAKVARATEGILLSSQFPVNYFALGQVEQWYGEEFRHEFERITGGVRLSDGNQDGWRFSRLHDYGPMRTETPEQLNTAMGQAVRSEVAEAVDEVFGRTADEEEEEEELPQGQGILDAFF
ncbi:hypothetical protein PLESTB_000068200 [Pleodorina starrii]|uniref:Uncharacterized protein n=1 Tax=Pleodorina starrii TaxID=330485 RepID=A0A9W6B9U2_9CHLO|nr:hypothetical protein PLESTM_001605100 [Pleodorina starrii]GLC48182.1 hypothetical protein PLESTB_000068200 [Pleodorina starrii]GLC67428.1 hypothetical protein PLESTF_000555200 [Pleodorina starrii]